MLCYQLLASFMTVQLLANILGQNWDTCFPCNKMVINVGKAFCRNVHEFFGNASLTLSSVYRTGRLCGNNHNRQYRKQWQTFIQLRTFIHFSWERKLALKYLKHFVICLSSSSMKNTYFDLMYFLIKTLNSQQKNI